MGKGFSTLHHGVAVVVFVAVTMSGGAQAMAARLPTDTVGRNVMEDLAPDASAQAPDAELPAGILLTQDGVQLWARQPDDPRAMASTTKIMTCLLVLESVDMDEVVSVSARAAAVGGSGVYLQTGETLTAGELLHALMMQSSNSAGTALAEHVAGSESAFVERMNERAVSMGLSETSYRNPHGLDAEGHYTSARDLAELANAAMQIEAFRELVSTEYAVIPGPGGERRLENSNELIGSYDGATGVKTGWTNPAGYCLVASARRGEVSLMCVVLGTRSEDARFEEARRLLDWGFEHYGPVTLASEEETIAAVSVSDYLDREVVARVATSTEALVLDLDGPLRREYEVQTVVDAPVVKGQQLGVLRVYQGDIQLGEIALVANEDVERPDVWERFRIFVIRLWRSWFGDPGAVPVPA